MGECCSFTFTAVACVGWRETFVYWFFVEAGYDFLLLNPRCNNSHIFAFCFFFTFMSEPDFLFVW